MNFMANQSHAPKSHLVKRLRYPDGTKRDISNTQNTDLLEAFGKAVGLMINSASHAALSIGDLRRLILPALEVQQYRIVERSGHPIGYASWAFVNADVDARLCGGDMRLSAEEWRCGNTPWLVDLIAPYGHGRYVLNELKHTVFPGMRVRTLQHLPKGGGVQVCQF